MLAVAKWKGERLEQLLDLKGKNPAWLGKQIGKPKQSVYQWIGGSEPRDDRVWDDIGKALRVDPELFRDRDKTLHKPGVPDLVTKVSIDQQNPAIKAFVRGDMAVLPVWRGVVAGTEDECYFVEDPEPGEVPAFLIEGRDIDKYVICIPAGPSMSPRIRQGEKAIARLGSNPPLNTIVVARNPENQVFIKVLREKNGRMELHSINGQYPPITEVSQWQLIGSVRAIWREYEPGAPNIEWDNGRPLKA